MLEEMERAREMGNAERSLGGWSTVAAAWLLVIIFVVLFATGMVTQNVVAPASAQSKER